jgi:hypothetical protein
MEETDIADAVFRLARAFADPNRLRIAAALIDAQLGLDQLATRLQLRPTEVSRQLTRLRESGLVIERTIDGETSYAFDANELRRLSRVAFATDRAASPEIDGEAWEQKTLRDFVKGGRLIEIPASRKKRLVVLNWLASQFEPGARLPERDVNEILGRYHPDFATLRRELVDNRFLDRDHGIYWRIE